MSEIQSWLDEGGCPAPASSDGGSQTQSQAPPPAAEPTPPPAVDQSSTPAADPALTPVADQSQTPVGDQSQAPAPDPNAGQNQCVDPNAPDPKASPMSVNVNAVLDANPFTPKPGARCEDPNAPDPKASPMSVNVNAVLDANPFTPKPGATCEDPNSTSPNQSQNPNPQCVDPNVPDPNAPNQSVDPTLHVPPITIEGDAEAGRAYNAGYSDGKLGLPARMVSVRYQNDYNQGYFDGGQNKQVPWAPKKLAPTPEAPPELKNMTLEEFERRKAEEEARKKAGDTGKDLKDVTDEWGREPPHGFPPPLPAPVPGPGVL